MSKTSFALARRLEVLVENARAEPGPDFDEYFVAGLCQRVYARGHHADAVLVILDLAGNADLHLNSCLVGRAL